ncbi:hypothetical protein RUND412_001286 [Rhizina undulata]
MAVLSKVLTAALAATSLFAGALAHADEGSLLVSRDVHEAKARRSLANCASKLKSRDFVERRVNKRNAMVDRHVQKKRDLGTPIISNPMSKRTDVTDLFPEVSCVLTPELTVGPYFVSGELIRDDLREDQYGIELLLDVQLIDVNTCEPVVAQYVDLWHCNSTGVYSGVSAEDTLGLTFLRGLVSTDDDGIFQATTNFPGWYSGRATHLHVAAHINGSVLDNGTYTGGTVAHIGQIFFPETILAQVDEADVYNTNTIVRTSNADDQWYPSGNTSTYDAEATVEYLGTALTDGLLAYISIGVDPTEDYSESLTTATDVGGVGGSGAMPSGDMPSGAMPSGVAPSGFSML